MRGLGGVCGGLEVDGGGGVELWALEAQGFGFGGLEGPGGSGGPRLGGGRRP